MSTLAEFEHVNYWEVLRPRIVTKEKGLKGFGFDSESDDDDFDDDFDDTCSLCGDDYESCPGNCVYLAKQKQ